jgi:DNA-binding GntR family transcriptional regulator
MAANKVAAASVDIYQNVYNAIVELRLMPGTKLSEERDVPPYLSSTRL